MKHDADNELKVITEYIASRWEGFDKNSVEDFVAAIWNKSVELTKGTIETENVLNIIQGWKKQRDEYNNWVKAGTTMSQEQFDQVKGLDAVNKAFMWFIMGPMDIQSAFDSQWDFEKVCKDLMKQLKADFLGIAKIKPKGWLKLSKNYSSYDGMSEYNETQAGIDRKEFKGIHSGTATTHSFTTRIALPYVMYNDKDQGVTALDTLIGTIVAHAYALSSQNNNADLVTNVQALKDKYNTPEYYKEILLSMDLKNTLTSPVGRALNVIMEDKITWTTPEELKEATNKTIIEEKSPKLGSLESKQKIANIMANIKGVPPLPPTAQTPREKEKEDKKLLQEKILAAFDTVVVSKKLKM